MMHCTALRATFIFIRPAATMRLMLQRKLKVSRKILIRGVEPKDGLDIMQANRPKTGSELTNGPGKLMQAFGVTDLRWNNVMITDSPFKIDLQDQRVPAQILTSARIGVSKRGGQTNSPYRYYVAGNPYVSGMRKREMNLATHGWLAQ